LKKAKEICARHNVLFIADEIQTGLGRTGKLFAFQHEGFRPDMIIIGKSLGGGCYPISAVLADNAVMGVFKPGEHGSTFGGNPLACAVAPRSPEGHQGRKAGGQRGQDGLVLHEEAEDPQEPLYQEVRGKGLLIGVELYPEAGGARRFCEALKDNALLCKETHDNVIRFAPPLIIGAKEIDWAFARISEVFAKLEN